MVLRSVLADDYKLTPKLTLNLGLRWDHESPRTEQFNRIGNFDFTGTTTLSNGAVITGGPEYPGVNGLPRGTWVPSYKNFGPRFGFAYNFRHDTVIRGGYGLFYANSWGAGRNNNAMSSTPGFVCSTTSPLSLDGGLTPYATLSSPFPQGFCAPSGSSLGLQTNLGQQMYVLSRKQPLPYMQSWDLSIQRVLPEK